MPDVTVPLEIAAGGTEVLEQPHALQKNHPRAVLTISLEKSDMAVKKIVILTIAYYNLKLYLKNPNTVTLDIDYSWMLFPPGFYSQYMYIRAVKYYRNPLALSGQQ